MVNVIKKVIHILSNLVYILALLFAIIELPILFGYKPLVVLSGSMEPTYKVGSVLYYHKTTESDLKVGDVITFGLGEDSYVTHRIHAIEDGLYETKGDANISVDAKKIGFDEIKGKVSKINIPYAGYAIQYILKYHIVIIGILVIILVSEFLLSNVKTFGIDEKNGKRKGVKNDGGKGNAKK